MSSTKVVTGKGIEGGAKLVLDPDLQERSALPCDSGSDRQSQESEFPNLDFSHLEPAWTSKVGIYAADDNSVRKRAAKFRGNLRDKSLALKDGERKGVMIITYGVLMKFLVGDPAIDLQKARWASYTAKKGHDGGVILVLA